MASIKEILVLVLRVIDSLERLASAQERIAAAEMLNRPSQLAFRLRGVFFVLFAHRYIIAKGYLQRS